jgi:hypothetical protein
MPGEFEKARAFNRLVSFCKKYKERLDSGDENLLRKRDSLLESCRQAAELCKDWGGG